MSVTKIVIENASASATRSAMRLTNVYFSGGIFRPVSEG